MRLAQHVIELFLRTAKSFECLPEIDIDKILEQPVTDPDCAGKQLIGKEIELHGFIFEEDLGEDLRGYVLVRFGIDDLDVVALMNQPVNLLQAHVAAAGGVVVTPVRVLADIQGSRLTVIFCGHGGRDDDGCFRDAPTALSKDG